jgi:uncharacterized protein
MNPRRWLRRHSLKLLAIRDTPEAIAGGVAIGIFFGFAPFFGLKTVLAILFAWLTRSNILAAVLAGALHDIIFPLMPVIYRWQYDLGYWLLSQPHHWPPSFRRFRWEDPTWRTWSTLFSVGKPLVVGGSLWSAPFAFLAFLVTRKVVARHQLKKPAPAPAVAEDDEANPS